MVAVVFFSILVLVPVLTVAWAWSVDRRLRAARAGAWARLAAIAFAGAFLFVYGWMILRRSGLLAVGLPSWAHAFMLLWALLFLPFFALPLMGGWTVLGLARRLAGVWAARGLDKADRDEAVPERARDAGLTRRELMSRTVAMLPAAATLGTTAISIPQKHRFLVRDLAVPIPELPAALDGARLVHLSDTHVGKFTRGEVLRRIADETNRLEADLVLFTGDLIDQSVDDLPEALDMFARIDPRSGLFIVEGNHDLFDGVEPFVRGVRARGVPLLRDEAAGVRVRGWPVQVLGIRWHQHGGSIAGHVDAVTAHRDPDAFPILLAHHPHAFDQAIVRGIPLTLAGHTHGGQLMVTPGLGAGPLLFKYWSGLYQREGRSLVVSNGAGNWFPLRTCAPAEIVRLTLHRV